MNVLIVDDQYEKVKTYCKILKDIGITQIQHVTCTREALRILHTDDNIDLLILDLQLPEILGDDVNPRGGIDLLELVELSDKYFTPKYVIAVTSFKETYEAQSDFFEKRGWSFIFGTEDEDSIKQILQNRLKYSKHKYKKHDIAILTALNKVEFESIKMLPITWEKVTYENDTNIYYCGIIELTDGTVKSIITTSCPRKGVAAAASIATKLLLRFEPDYIIMTGIAAGIKGKVRIGDLLVADVCWDWGSGKLTVKDGVPTFLGAPHQLSIDPIIRAKMEEHSIQRTFLDEIKLEWKNELGHSPEYEIQMHVGPVATGSVVLEDPKTVELIKSQNKDTIGIEMEAYGVMAAVEYANHKAIKAIVIKSVCDFADIEKNDDYQRYAAYASANYAYRLIRNGILNF